MQHILMMTMNSENKVNIHEFWNKKYVVAKTRRIQNSDIYVVIVKVMSRGFWIHEFSYEKFHFTMSHGNHTAIWLFRRKGENSKANFLLYEILITQKKSLKIHPFQLFLSKH